MTWAEQVSGVLGSPLAAPTMSFDKLLKQWVYKCLLDFPYYTSCYKLSNDPGSWTSLLRPSVTPAGALTEVCVESLPDQTKLNLATAFSSIREHHLQTAASAIAHAAAHPREPAAGNHFQRENTTARFTATQSLSPGQLTLDMTLINSTSSPAPKTTLSRKSTMAPAAPVAPLVKPNCSLTVVCSPFQSWRSLPPLPSAVVHLSGVSGALDFGDGISPSTWLTRATNGDIGKFIVKPPVRQHFSVDLSNVSNLVNRTKTIINKRNAGAAATPFKSSFSAGNTSTGRKGEDAILSVGVLNYENSNKLPPFTQNIECSSGKNERGNIGLFRSLLRAVAVRRMESDPFRAFVNVLLSNSSALLSPSDRQAAHQQSEQGDDFLESTEDGETEGSNDEDEEEEDEEETEAPPMPSVYSSPGLAAVSSEISTDTVVHSSLSVRAPMCHLTRSVVLPIPYPLAWVQEEQDVIREAGQSSPPQQNEATKEGDIAVPLDLVLTPAPLVSGSKVVK